MNQSVSASTGLIRPGVRHSYPRLSPPASPDRGTDSSRSAKHDSEAGTALNVAGAFPLLLVGAALVVSAVILYLQTARLPGHSLPVWELVALVGATVLTAGVLSLFLAEAVESTPGPAIADPVLLDEEFPSPTGREDPRQIAAPQSATPPWWEGPPIRVPAPESGARPTFRPPDLPASKPPDRPEISGATSEFGRPPPQVVRSEEPSEIATALRELDGISEDVLTTSRSNTGTTGTPAARCGDCGRRMDRKEKLLQCELCGLRFCSTCAGPASMAAGPVLCRACREMTA